MAQDPEHSIILHLCSQCIWRLGKVIPIDYLEIDILEKTIEFVYDSKIEIKLVALQAVFYMLNDFSEEIMKSRIKHFLIDITGSVNIEVVKLVASNFKLLIPHFAKIIQDSSIFQTYLSKVLKDYLSYDVEPILQNVCLAFLELSNIMESKYLENMKQLIFHSISNFESIRRIILESLEKHIKFFGLDVSLNIIRSSFKSESRNVLRIICFKIGIILQNFNEINHEYLLDNNEELFEDFDDLLKIISRCRESKCFEVLINSFSVIFSLNLFTGIQIKHFLGKILDYLPILYLNSFDPLAKMTAICYRCKFNTSLKNSFVQKMIKDFKKSEKYHLRIFFAKFSHQVILRSSKTLIRSLIFNEILSLSKDKVPNVRLSCIPCLYELRKIFSWNDEELLLLVRESLCRLQVDRDKQVKEEADNYLEKIKKFNIDTIESIRLSDQRDAALMKEEETYNQMDSSGGLDEERKISSKDNLDEEKKKKISTSKSIRTSIKGKVDTGVKRKIGTIGPSMSTSDPVHKPKKIASMPFSSSPTYNQYSGRTTEKKTSFVSSSKKESKKSPNNIKNFSKLENEIKAVLKKKK